MNKRKLPGDGPKLGGRGGGHQDWRGLEELAGSSFRASDVSSSEYNYLEGKVVTLGPLHFLPSVCDFLDQPNPALQGWEWILKQ